MRHIEKILVLLLSLFVTKHAFGDMSMSNMLNMMPQNGGQMNNMMPYNMPNSDNMFSQNQMPPMNNEMGEPYQNSMNLNQGGISMQSSLGGQYSPNGLSSLLSLDPIISKLQLPKRLSYRPAERLPFVPLTKRPAAKRAHKPRGKTTPRSSTGSISLVTSETATETTIEPSGKDKYEETLDELEEEEETMSTPKPSVKKPLTISEKEAVDLFFNY